MRVIASILLLIATLATSFANDVRVFIAPRSAKVPRSGKILFDVYWINDSTRIFTIPSSQRYSFDYETIGRMTGPVVKVYGASVQTASHPSADRPIGPGVVIHDTVIAEIDPQGARLVSVTAEFRGRKATFKSNTVVLRIP